MSDIPTHALLAPLARALEAQGPLAEDLLDDLSTTWTTGQVTTLATTLPPDVLGVVRQLSDALAEVSRSGLDPQARHDLFEGARGAVVLAWAEGAARRRDVVLAPLLSEALRALQPPSRLIRAARARVVHGTLIDGLACLPLAGDPAWLLDSDPEHQRALDRTELLILEAASSAMSMPALGTWLFGSPELFDRFVADKSRGTLRDRIAAASLLAIAGDGFPPTGFTLAKTSPRAGATVRIVRTLASHPEPVVWIPAAIALGRLASRSSDARGLLCLWLHGDAIGERRRAITALAAMTGLEVWALDKVLEEIITTTEDPWELAALGPAIPFLSVEHRELFGLYLARLRSDQAPVEALWSATRGLLALAKRGPIDRATDTLLRGARERSLDARVLGATQAQLWADIRRRTDFLDGIDPDPSDPELLLERAASSAVELGSERVAPRAEAIARSIGPIFGSALARARNTEDAVARAAALAAIDSSVRAASIALWEVILGPGADVAANAGRGDLAANAGRGDFAANAGRGDLTANAGRGALVSNAGRGDLAANAGRDDLTANAGRGALASNAGPGDLAAKAARRDDDLASELEQVRNFMLERATAMLPEAAGDFALSRSLLRALGLLIDAPGAEPKSVRAGRVLRAIDSIARERTLEPRDVSRLKKPIADALWRVVDATRPHSITLPDNVVYSRFAAWCALSAESELLLESLPRAEAAARGLTANSVATTVANIRAALDPRAPGALEGKWLDPVVAALDALGFGASALAESVAALGVALESGARARTTRDSAQLSLALISLGEAASQLSALLADPARALDLSTDSSWPSDHYRDLAASTVQVISSGSTISAADADPLLANWAAGLGILGPLVANAVRAILSVRTERSGVHQRTPSIIGAYRLIERRGRGAQGEAWLVEHERTARRFVMKLLPERALAARTPEERADLERALGYEGDILKTIYHPNVANFVDYGVVQDRCYLVLEYLVGCDLGDYAEAHPLDLSELKPIVHDTAAGLAAISAFGLIHGDLKPGNIFLRLALPPEDMRFVAARDRNTTTTPLLGAVVIDLGVARTLSSAEIVGHVSGTPGYLAPEQAHGKAHPKTDVYSLAATIYRALAGRAFFAHLEELGARVFAHASRQPFDDPTHLHALPPLPHEAIALLKEATAMNPEARPDLATFARRFAAL